MKGVKPVSKIDIGIDLGTTNTIIYQKSKGIILEEPSVVAVNSNGSVISVGKKAKEMLGRTPEGVRAINPIRHGVIADFDMAALMLEYFVKKLVKSVFRPKFRAAVGVPSSITNVENKALKEVVTRAGIRDAVYIDEVMAAAIGSGLCVNSPNGIMVVDIGGGTTDVAIISLGGIVYVKTVRIGGDSFDEAISDFIRRKYGIHTGSGSVERIKQQIGTVMKNSGNVSSQIRGLKSVNGLPASIYINGNDIRTAILPGVYLIVDAIKSVISEAPPELASDILESGIELTGGGACIDGIDRIICNATGMPVKIADNPLKSVASGLGEIIEKKFDLYKT
ncbi:MAG: rod shape-determining protein [Clostridia bacterium]|nr:rod shape-determining protein [Clostridia bacterium]